MKKQVKVNKKGLVLLQLIQDRLKASQHEETLKLTEDSYFDTLKYYKSLPFTIFLETGLINSKECFDAIIQYPLAEKTKFMQVDDINGYAFNY